MNNKKALEFFREMSSIWENALSKYTYDQLTQKPAPEKWSLGQLYLHLLDGTMTYQLKKIEKCIKTPKHKDGKKSFKGFLAMNILKSFPPIKIKVPPSKEYTPQQPKSMEEIKAKFRQLNESMEKAYRMLSQDTGGKSGHPAFGFLTASEWFRLIPMHFKHHLRQKKELEMFLRKGK